jgi:uncharacterized protein involved in exopolysaccharide biosynthesis
MEQTNDRRAGAAQAPTAAGVAPRVRDGAARGAEPPGSADVSLVSLVNVVLRQLGLVLLATVVAAGITVATLLSRPRTYRATAVFAESSRRASGGAAGLAAQLGLNVPGGDATSSPQFYVDLLDSRTVLAPLVDRSYRTASPAGPRRVGLVEIYKAPGRTPALRREAAIDRLGRDLRASVTPQTGVVTLTVDAPAPDLAAEIATAAVRLLEAFNLERRQTQAGAEVRFTEARLAAARTELRQAEARLEAFLEQNRAYVGAPALRLANEQLAREVGFRQQVYTSLAQAYEQARIDAVRDTPVITLIEAPEPPVRPRPRGLVQWTAVALVAGLLLGVVAAFVSEYLRRTAAASGPDVEEFRALRHHALGNVRQPWNPVLRLLRLRRRA